MLCGFRKQRKRKEALKGMEVPLSTHLPNQIDGASSASSSSSVSSNDDGEREGATEEERQEVLDAAIFGTINGKLDIDQVDIHGLRYLNLECLDSDICSDLEQIRGNKDKDIVLAAVRENPDYLSYMTLEHRADKDIALAAMSEGPWNFEYVAADLRGDRSLVLKTVESMGLALEHASFELRGDKEIVTVACRQNGMALEYASDHLKSDKDVILLAYQENAEAIQYASEKTIRKDAELKKFLIEQLAADKIELEDIPEALRGQRDVVLAAMELNPGSLQEASSMLRDDKEVVLAAIKGGGTVLEHASNRLKENKEVVMAACKSESQALQFASKKLKRVKEIIAAACETAKGYWPLVYAAESVVFSDPTWTKGFVEEVATEGIRLREQSKTIQARKDVVLAAVKRYGRDLEYASPALQDDKKVVLTAVNNLGPAIDFASERLKRDKGVAMAALQQSPYVHFQEFSESLRSDRYVVIAACRVEGSRLRYASEELKGDKEVVMVACRARNDSIQYASRVLLANADFMVEATDTYPMAIQCASKQLQSDKCFVLVVCAKNGMGLECASAELRKDYDIVLAACSNKGQALQFGSTQLRQNKELVRKICAKQGDALLHASKPLRQDKEVVLAAAASSPKSLKYALDGLNQDRDCLVAANLWDQTYDEKQEAVLDINEDGSEKKIVLSTRFALGEKSNPNATNFTAQLKSHPYIQDGNFITYPPNAFAKDTCDPEWTRMEWPCRGTYETCKKEDPSLRTGKPKLECCWRYSFRCRLEEAKRTGGFMIQVVDFVESGNPRMHETGMGQDVETLMAKEVGTKVFRILQPICYPWNDGGGKHNRMYALTVDQQDINSLVSHIRSWYQSNDTTIGEVDLREWQVSRVYEEENRRIVESDPARHRRGKTLLGLCEKCHTKFHYGRLTCPWQNCTDAQAHEFALMQLVQK